MKVLLQCHLDTFTHRFFLSIRFSFYRRQLLNFTFHHLNMEINYVVGQNVNGVLALELNAVGLDVRTFIQIIENKQ